MPLETATFISQLVSSNPASTDSEGQGSNHLRLIKAVLQAQFPNFTAAALSSTNAEIDAAVAAALAGEFTLAAGTVGAPALALQSDATTGVYSAGVGKIDIAVGGAQALEINSTGLAVNNRVSTATLSVAGTDQTQAFVPTGGTLVWWTNTAPAGYLFCNGQAVSRTTFSALFALLGTTYGIGDGSTTFNLPDLREATPVGGDMGAGTNSRITNFVMTLGSFIGECLHTLVTGEMPAHTHTATVTDPGHVHPAPNSGKFSVQEASGNNSGQTGSNFSALETNTGSATTGISVSNASQGGGTSHNNVGPSIVCNWIIKT